MFLELVATLVAGIAGAGLVMLLNKVLGGRLPRWMAPVAAGAAMLAATISSEYSWYSRTSAGLPDDLVVAQTVQDQAFYRPWTFAFPLTVRFMAVDQVSVRTHADAPDMRLADLLFFGRWSPVRAVSIVVDCGQFRQAPVTDAVTFESDGTIKGAVWSAPDTGSKPIQLVCEVEVS